METIFKGLPFILVQNKKPSSGFHHLKKTLKRLGLDPVSVFQGHHPSLYPVICRFFSCTIPKVSQFFWPNFLGKKNQKKIKKQPLRVSKKRLQKLSLAYKQENPKARNSKDHCVLPCTVNFFCLKPASNNFCTTSSTLICINLLFWFIILPTKFCKRPLKSLTHIIHILHLNCQFQGQMWFVQAKNHRTKKLLV